MKQFFKKIFSFFLGKTFGQSFFKFLHFISIKGMNFGGGAHPGDSGEVQVIQYVLGKLPKAGLVIFDVGANKGDYTKIFLRVLEEKQQQAVIYVFEPSMELFQNLKKDFLPNQNVKLNQKALGENQGSGILYGDQPGSGLGSLINRDLVYAGIAMSNKEAVVVDTLDNFCAQEKISQIDFLKLDVEGFEFAALKGGAELIKNKKIRFIQFEFGGTDIDARIFFKDFYQLLSENYKISRVLKNGLAPIKKYSEFEEIFLTTNYLAELK